MAPGGAPVPNGSAEVGTLLDSRQPGCDPTARLSSFRIVRISTHTGASRWSRASTSAQSFDSW
jgi:hypothetical protein